MGTRGFDSVRWGASLHRSDVPADQRLSNYARSFLAVEVLETFFDLPSEPKVRDWRDAVPDGFRFSFDVPRQVTHDGDLTTDRRSLTRLLRRLEILGPKTGPLLARFSPRFTATKDNRRRLKEFCRSLSDGFRWALEFRDPAWIDPETTELCAQFGVAIVSAVSRWLPPDVSKWVAANPTTDFAYLRWVEPPRLPRTSVADRSEDLFDGWQPVIRELEERRLPVLAFFGNRFTRPAPELARTFQAQFGMSLVS